MKETHIHETRWGEGRVVDVLMDGPPCVQGSCTAAGTVMRLPGKVWFFECGICSCVHPWDFHGDCREDKNRYDTIEEYGERHKRTDFDFELRSMCARLKADGMVIHDQLGDIREGRCRFCGEEV